MLEEIISRYLVQKHHETRGRPERVRCTIALVFLAFFTKNAEAQAFERCPAQGGNLGRVLFVDEKLDLTLEDGQRIKIAGIEPPRPTPDDPELDIRARDRLASWLAGEEVYFTPAERGLDRWGRKVAFVFAAQPGQAGPLAPLSVAEAVLDAGLARYEASAAGYLCREKLLAVESGARAAGIGLWGDPYYAVLAADNPQLFADRLGTIVIVEGRVSRIVDRRPRILLYFGFRRGSDLSIALVPRTGKTFESAYRAAAGLSGRIIRVRGLLDNHFGPQIEISDPSDIESAEH